MMEDVSWVSGPTLPPSSGSLNLDLLLDQVSAFVRLDPLEVSNKICPVCETPESEQPTIFRDGKGCSDLCRKVHRGDLTPEQADQIHRNLTKK